MTVVTRHRVLLVLAVVVVLAALVPLLRANATARDQAWHERCAAQGGAVWSEPADTANPLVVHTGHPVQRCVDATGVVVSVRD
jgi:hypothetical protein